MAVPAALAGVLVAFLSPTVSPPEGSAPGTPAPGRLAELAGGPTLRPATAGALRPARPERISIPAAGVEAEVDAMGARGEGIDVPPEQRAGWFELGPRPGEPGHAVIIGHRDGRAGPAVFAEVPALGAGESVTVLDRRGVEHRYRVVGTAHVRKERFPTEEVYARSRRPVLVLVTCGGEYDPATGYEENVLVYARAA